jgi:hypothetical protein
LENIMTQRIALLARGTARVDLSLCSALAAIAVVAGCAKETSSSARHELPEFASDPDIAVQFQALTVVECNRQAERCLIANPLRPVSCSLQLADCLASSAATEAIDLTECTLDSVGCTLDAVAQIACEDLVDCQQDVARCVSDSVHDLTGASLDPILDELDPYGDEVGETCGEVVHVVGQVGGVVVDATQNAVENAVSALKCANDARACVREHPTRWLPCQVDFAACNAQVAAKATADTFSTAVQTGGIVAGVVDGAIDSARDSAVCAAKYAKCRSDGGDYWKCSDAARACELEAL